VPKAGSIWVTKLAGRAGEDRRDGGPERDLVAAGHPCRVVGVGGAAEEAQQRHVVHVRQLGAGEADAFTDRPRRIS
jgi:hypothetical protein